jgi:putative endonuclease
MGTRNFYVYILASRIGGTLYIGVTNDLIRRVAEHKAKAAEGFTKKYDVDRLFISNASMTSNKRFTARSD